MKPIVYATRRLARPVGDILPTFPAINFGSVVVAVSRQSGVFSFAFIAEILELPHFDRL